MRECGMLLPIASLPSRYGIGAFSKDAYAFVDTLKAAGQSYWQVLPLGPTGFGDSPYQSFSAFAGNPYFIDLETLVEEGLLTLEECEAVDFGEDPRKIWYDKIYEEMCIRDRAMAAPASSMPPLSTRPFRESSLWALDKIAFFTPARSRSGRPE